MWKRVPKFNRGKESNIGNPSLIETTFDEKALRNLPDVGDAQTASHQFERRDTDDTITSPTPLG